MDKGRLFSGDWSGILWGIVIILAACGLFGIRLARRRDNGTNPNLIPENIKMASIFFGIGLVAGVLLAYFHLQEEFLTQLLHFLSIQW